MSARDHPNPRATALMPNLAMTAGTVGIAGA